MIGHPNVVKQVVTIITITSILFSFTGGILLVLTIASSNIQSLTGTAVIGASLLMIGILHGILAYGFHNLRRWSYAPTKYLVGLNNITAMSGLVKELDSEEIRHAFGIVSTQDNES